MKRAEYADWLELVYRKWPEADVFPADVVEDIWGDVMALDFKSACDAVNVMARADIANGRRQDGRRPRVRALVSAVRDYASGDPRAIERMLPAECQHKRRTHLPLQVLEHPGDDALDMLRKFAKNLPGGEAEFDRMWEDCPKIQDGTGLVECLDCGFARPCGCEGCLTTRKEFEQQLAEVPA